MNSGRPVRSVLVLDDNWYLPGRSECSNPGRDAYGSRIVRRASKASAKPARCWAPADSRGCWLRAIVLHPPSRRLGRRGIEIGGASVKVSPESRIVDDERLLPLVAHFGQFAHHRHDGSSRVDDPGGYLSDL